jgi:hypothetical protein
VSLEAHASTVSSDDVSYSRCFSFLSFHVLLLLHSSFIRLWSKDLSPWALNVRVT